MVDEPNPALAARRDYGRRRGVLRLGDGGLDERRLEHAGGGRARRPRRAASVGVDEPLADEHANHLGRGARALLRGAARSREAIVASASSERAAPRVGLRELERRLRVGARAGSPAPTIIDDLRRQEPLAQQAAAGLRAPSRAGPSPTRARRARRPRARRARSRRSGVRRSSSAKPAVRWNASCGRAPPLPPPFMPSRCATGFAGSGGSPSSGLRSTSVSLPFSARWSEPGVDDPEQAATAQEADLARDVAAEALGRVEADEDDLERADGGSRRCSCRGCSVPRWHR